MKKLSRKIEYALIALRFMAMKSRDQRTTVKEICLRTQIPFDATARVMQLMVQKQILKAEHGVHGGYNLNKNLAGVSFLDVIEAVSGPVEIARCIGGDEDCEFASGCNMIFPIKIFNKKLKHFYQTLMVSELMLLDSTRPSQLEVKGG